MTRRIRNLIREGTGVRQHRWYITTNELASADGLAPVILDWVKEAMGTMRRPHGIDYVALALACRDADGRPHCSTSLGVLRPQDFYEEAGAAGIDGFIRDVDMLPSASRHEVSAALVCLGDIAYALAEQAA